MQATVRLTDLRNAVKIANYAVPSRTVLPVISGIRFQAIAKDLEIAASSISYSFTFTVMADIKEEGKTVIPGKLLATLLQRLPKGDSLTIKAQKNSATIQYGNSSYEMPVFDPNDFPTVPTPGESLAMFKPEDLRKAIAYTSFSTLKPKETIRAALTAIAIILEPDKVTFASTDGYRLSLHTIPTKTSIEEKKTILIPAEDLTRLESILSFYEPDYVFLSVTSDGIFFFTSNFSAHFRPLEGPEFPNYTKVIPQEWKIPLIVPRKPLLEALKRLVILAPEHSERISISLERNSPTMYLSASTKEKGSSTEKIETLIPAIESGSFAIRATNLIQPLSVLSCETISLVLNTPTSPALLRPVERETIQESPLFVVGLLQPEEEKK